MKVCFETFGCRLNKAEALQMEADYLASGWEVTDRHADANLIVVRGCSVTSRAQYECEKLISHLRRRYPNADVKVCGCLKSDDSSTQTPNHPIPQSPNLPVRTARAYLKVQDGCSGKCTFCIVPSFRGPSKSENFAALLDRAKRFIEAGYHEIVVTGCNLALYASESKRLPDLVAALAGLDAGCRVRLGSVEPGPCALETVAAMAEHPNVCRFLHLPIQSGSGTILQAMRRPYAVRDIEETAFRATKLMPGIGLGCDLIAGFPGESDLDFLATRGLLKRIGFSNAHVFPFSSRPDTIAAGLPRQVPREIRSARAQELAEDVRSKRHAFARKFFGKTVEIVVEDEKHGRGWTGEYLPCELIGKSPARKSLARVLVTETRGSQLLGRLAPGDARR